MQKCFWRVLVATLLTAVWAVLGSCWASDPSQTDRPKPAPAKAEQPSDRFELKDGDRVLFIGNTERKRPLRLEMIDHGDATAKGQFVSGE